MQKKLNKYIPKYKYIERINSRQMKEKKTDKVIKLYSGINVFNDICRVDGCLWL